MHTFRRSIIALTLLIVSCVSAHRSPLLRAGPPGIQIGHGENEGRHQAEGPGPGTFWLSVFFKCLVGAALLLVGGVCLLMPSEALRCMHQLFA